MSMISKPSFHHIFRLVPLMWCLLVVLLSSCKEAAPEVPDAANAIYYWRSELTLDNYERQFLAEHDVKKVYLHLFDVVRRDGHLHPQATLQFTDTLPKDITVIPIVFLTPDVLNDTTDVAQLPHLIALRVREMMVQNELPAPTELQMDFDWTKRNQPKYFSFLEALRPELEEQGIHRLSATIRLHQLSMMAPPVDYGSLMVYNVGRLQAFDEQNSILSTEAVAPYMKYLADYPLPLCTALPVYRWDLLFHDERFRCILRGFDVADTTRFMSIDPTHYLAKRYQVIPTNTVTSNSEGRIYPGDVIRHEAVSAQTLTEVQALLRKQRPGINSQTILYHLDNQQLKAYTHDEIEKLYSGS